MLSVLVIIIESGCVVITTIVLLVGHCHSHDKGRWGLGCNIPETSELSRRNRHQGFWGMSPDSSDMVGGQQFSKSELELTRKESNELEANRLMW